MMRMVMRRKGSTLIDRVVPALKARWWLHHRVVSMEVVRGEVRIHVRAAWVKRMRNSMVKMRRRHRAPK
jgi:hypothetical protein